MEVSIHQAPTKQGNTVLARRIRIGSMMARLAAPNRIRDAMRYLGRLLDSESIVAGRAVYPPTVGQAVPPLARVYLHRQDPTGMDLLFSPPRVTPSRATPMLLYRRKTSTTAA